MRMAGIGFRGAASVASLRDALARANPEGLKIDALVTEAAKARATVFRDFAQELGVPGLGITTEDLGRMITPTQSARIEDRFGTGSLSEAAALAAAGPGAVLVAERVVSGDAMATAAIAETKGKTP
ncbi:precorrin methylase [Sulfitobacter sp. HI0082]|uniref:Cobalamin biosynthesis protein n=1 Tax=Sulfitobacter profundi TaxID=2679961 RepID=A0ABW1YWF0_9RHOB|nr:MULTISPECIES: cobalamin biosynthesis protein [Sulfitobacter]KZZ24290.1 precorrin methylase [Sulfitobacter sp. HI0082]AYE87520.1 precorrin methylase [Sulfitobacter sp. D7]MCZ4365612.1 cobalamin biosynthesis protein [Sulfitobacter dubius]UWR33435.1 cobalamin biosynthesis protein [Sulfitobacter sp. W027]UWR37389.1 cobalamin biosynthesis protein [Sulfitobacter sp. W074]